MFKYRLRALLDLFALGTGLLAGMERRMRSGLTILMYHRILPLAECRDYPFQANVMPVEVFRAQMRWLSIHCQVLPVRSALESWQARARSYKPLVAVTFDDGYHDSSEYAAPILEEYGLRGTFFVTSGFVSTGQPLWYDRAAAVWPVLAEQHRQLLLSKMRQAVPAAVSNDGGRQFGEAMTWMQGLKRMDPPAREELMHFAASSSEAPPDMTPFRPLTSKQVGKLHANGHEIGSHTVAHPLLPQLDDNELQAELQESKAMLASWTGAAVDGFCCPNGDYDQRVEEAVTSAGYRYACLAEEGLNRPAAAPTRLARLPITMVRTMVDGRSNDLRFRAEVCRLRSLWRR